MLTVDVKGIGLIRDLGARCSLLRLLPAYAAGLRGLEVGDRVQVLYWMHALSRADRLQLQLHPRGDESLPLRGVFGLRSCTRPNPIGVSEVEIVEVRETGVVVSGLDARDGSPLIDIKAACR